MTTEEMPRCPKNSAHPVYQDDELAPQVLLTHTHQGDFPLRRVIPVLEAPPWWCRVCGDRLTEAPMPS